MVQAYNLPADVLFSDFIASGDTETQSIAENVVRGFKKAFQEMLELKEANPNQYNRIGYRNKQTVAFTNKFRCSKDIGMATKAN